MKNGAIIEPLRETQKFLGLRASGVSPAESREICGAVLVWDACQAYVPPTPPVTRWGWRCF